MAQVISWVFQPMVAITAYFLALAAFQGPWAWAAVGWGCLVVVPGGLLAWGMARGVWQDPDLGQLRERRTFLPWPALSASAGAALATVGQAPWTVRLVLVSVALWLGASTLLSQFWKVSLHEGGTVGVVLLVWHTLGVLPALALCWAPAAVAWSRWTLGRHDIPQLVGGAALAAACVAVAGRLLGPG
jgi:hypothetical protein